MGAPVDGKKLLLEQKARQIFGLTDFNFENGF